MGLLREAGFVINLGLDMKAGIEKQLSFQSCGEHGFWVRIES